MNKMPKARKRKSLNFESIINSGQNPLGFTAQTPNGTAKAGVAGGWNKDFRWPPMSEAPTDQGDAWNNANRSGE